MIGFIFNLLLMIFCVSCMAMEDPPQSSVELTSDVIAELETLRRSTTSKAIISTVILSTAILIRGEESNAPISGNSIKQQSQTSPERKLLHPRVEALRSEQW